MKSVTASCLPAGNTAEPAVSQNVVIVTRGLFVTGTRVLVGSVNVRSLRTLLGEYRPS